MSQSPACERLAMNDEVHLEGGNAMKRFFVTLQFPLLLGTVLFAWGFSASAAEPTSAGMYEIKFHGQKVEGSPIRWNSREIILLGRDGRLWTFDPRQVEGFQKSSDHFRPDSTSEIRATLLRELGDGYEVSGTTHYLVAHPRGQRDKWAERFEDLYRSFVHFFSVRGFNPSEPPFPLVGIVCLNRSGIRSPLQAANRSSGIKCCFLEQPAGGFPPIRLFPRFPAQRLLPRRGLLWARIEPDQSVRHGRRPTRPIGARTRSVLIHEATHQTAFNTGIHSRYCPPPKWLAEGLAMLFEAPGVYDSRNNTQLADRVNRERLRAFRQSLAPRHRPEMLSAMVASDDLFRVNPAAAYAEAWAMSFFLVETEPDKYVRYLKRTASRPAVFRKHGGRADGRFHGRFRRRLADAGGPVSAVHGGAAMTGGERGRFAGRLLFGSRRDV